MPADIRKKLPGMITIMFKGAWGKVYQYNSVMFKLMFQYSYHCLVLCDLKFSSTFIFESRLSVMKSVGSITRNQWAAGEALHQSHHIKEWTGLLQVHVDNQSCQDGKWLVPQTATCPERLPGAKWVISCPRYVI